MRIVFFLLLLANGLFWLWQTNVFSPPPKLRAPLPADVDKLVLLEEELPSEPAPPPAAALAALVSDAESPAQVAEQPAEVPVIASPEVSVEAPEKPNEAIEDAVEAPEIEMAAADSAVEPVVEPLAEVAPQPESKPEPEPEPESLELVSERVTAKVPERQCYTLGPFRDPALATGVQIRLAMMDIESSQRLLNEREFFGYAVYLPPRPTRAEAQQLTRELRSRGIDDYYIISNGDLENAVSLGLFRERKHADRLILRARQLGFQPQTESRYREQELIWLDYEDPEHAVGDNMLREISPEGALQRLGRDC